MRQCAPATLPRLELQAHTTRENGPHVRRSFWSEAGQTSVAFVVGAVGTIAGTVLSFAVLRPWLGAEGYKACCWWLSGISK